MMEADQLRGTNVDPRRGAKRVRDYGDEKFLPSLVHLRPNSASTYASHLRNHIYPLLGDHRIGSLARQDIKAFVSAKAAELAPSTVETVVSVLKAMLASAVEDGYIPLNPRCEGVTPPGHSPRPDATGTDPGPRSRACGSRALPGRSRSGRWRGAQTRRGNRTHSAASPAAPPPRPRPGASTERCFSAAEDQGITARRPDR